MTALGENLAALDKSSRHNRKMSREASQDRMTIRHLIRKVKKIVILKCLASNWTTFSFVLRKLLEGRCEVLLESNDGFFFDRHLSRAHINKSKGQQGHIFFLARCLLDLTNLLLYNNVFQIPHNYEKRPTSLMFGQGSPFLLLE